MCPCFLTLQKLLSAKQVPLFALTSPPLWTSFVPSLPLLGLQSAREVSQPRDVLAQLLTFPFFFDLPISRSPFLSFCSESAPARNHNWSLPPVYRYVIRKTPLNWGGSFSLTTFSFSSGSLFAQWSPSSTGFLKESVNLAREETSVCQGNSFSFLVPSSSSIFNALLHWSIVLHCPRECGGFLSWEPFLRAPSPSRPSQFPPLRYPSPVIKPGLLVQGHGQSREGATTGPYELFFLFISPFFDRFPSPFLLQLDFYFYKPCSPCPSLPTWDNVISLLLFPPPLCPPLFSFHSLQRFPPLLPPPPSPPDLPLSFPYHYRTPAMAMSAWKEVCYPSFGTAFPASPPSCARPLLSVVFC